jgi:hypothetical protein
LANALTKKRNENSVITAMHLKSSNEIHHYNVEEYEAETFAPIIHESEQLNQKITTLYKASSDIEGDIVEVANKGNYDLLLIGVRQSIYEGTLLGKILGFTTRIINPEKLINQVTGKESLFETSPFDDRTEVILNKSDISVGVFIDKGFEQPEKVIIPIYSEDDTFLIQFAQKLIKNASSQVTIIDAFGIIKNNYNIKESIIALEQFAPNHINLVSQKVIDKELIYQHDLLIISADSWKKLIDSKSQWLPEIPSALILTDKDE